MGMVIQLSRDLHLACEDNMELREALECQKVRLLRLWLLMPVVPGGIVDGALRPLLNIVTDTIHTVLRQVLWHVRVRRPSGAVCGEPPTGGCNLNPQTSRN